MKSQIVISKTLYSEKNVFQVYFETSQKDISEAKGLVSRRAGSATTYYSFDPSGNVTDISTNGVITTLDTDAYGGYAFNSSVPYGYGGQWGYYTDSQTGLILCGLRYYDPAQARWLTRDPIGYSGGMNLYGYVGGNPTGRVDPSGLISARGLWHKMEPYMPWHWPSSALNYLARPSSGHYTGPSFANANEFYRPALTNAACQIRQFKDDTVDNLALAVVGEVGALSAVGEESLNITRTFRELLEDIKTNPGNWERVGGFTEAGTSIRSKDGPSIQCIYQNTETGDRIVEHFVLNNNGKIIDGPHFRPGYKPRIGE